jgi:HD-like signal output (HDOD) protein
VELPPTLPSLGTPPTLAERFAAERDSLGDLPVPSGVLVQVMVGLGRPQTDLADLAEIVRGDVALTAQLLRAANSAALGRRAEITSVRDALLRIGVDRARRLVLVLTLRNTIERWRSPLPYDTFLAHSLGVANAAALIAERTTLPEARARSGDESLYLAGLFHDVGLLVLARHYPGEYESARHAALPAGRSLPEAERALHGSDHSELGGPLVQSWGLPEVTVAAIAGHHDAGRVAPQRQWAAHVLRLAEAVAVSAGFPDLDEGVAGNWDGTSQSILGLGPDALDQLIEATQLAAHRDRLLLIA